MASSRDGAERIQEFIHRYYPDRFADDERVRRVNTFFPFLEHVCGQTGWGTRSESPGVFVMYRQRPVPRGIFRQHVTFDILRASMRRLDQLEVATQKVMPPEIARRSNGHHSPIVFELSTMITGGPGNEQQRKIKRIQDVHWLYDRGVVGYGGGVSLTESADANDEAIPFSAVSLVMTGVDRFTDRWQVSDTMLINQDHTDVLHFGSQPDRVVPIGFLRRFAEVFGGIIPSGHNVHGFISVLRGLIHKSLNAVDIPDHPALRALV